MGVWRRSNAQRGSPWYIKYKDASGNWRYEQGYADKQATKQLLARREREAAQGLEGMDDPYKEHRKTPLAQHVEDFVVHLKARGRARRYLRNMEGYLTWAFDWMGATRPDDLSAHKTERFILALRDGSAVTPKGKKKKGKKQAGLSAKGCNNYVACLKQFGQWGVERWRWAVNPFASLKNLNVEANRKKVRRALTVPELRKSIEAAKVRGVQKYAENHRGGKPGVIEKLRRLGAERAVVYEVAASTGLRLNELKTLEWQHVNLDRAPAAITVAAEHTKSKRTDIILLPEGAADRLMDWRHRKVEELGTSPSLRERVFCISRRITPQFKKDCEFAGIPLTDEAGRVVDFHSLRHTYAQLLVNGGVHPRVAQTMLRHRDIRTTMKVYVRDDLAAQIAALDVLPTFDGGTEVQHIVQHAGRETGQGSAGECDGTQTSGNRKSSRDGTWGSDMQQAAAGGDGLHLVAGAGFEPAHEDAEPVGREEDAARHPAPYNTRYNTSGQNGPPEREMDPADPEVGG